MTKQALRKKYKDLRRALSPKDIEEKSLHIANQSLALPIWEKSVYHIFLSIAKQNEVDTQFLMHILSGRDKNIVVGKSDFKTLEMKHFLLTDDTPLAVNSLGIPEPQKGIEISPHQIEVVFIPLLAYDLRGNRVGYGKGFYDRFLAACPQETQKIGLSFFKPEQEISAPNPHDVPLDFCVTPTEIYEF